MATTMGSPDILDAVIPHYNDGSRGCIAMAGSAYILGKPFGNPHPAFLDTSVEVR